MNENDNETRSKILDLRMIIIQRRMPMAVLEKQQNCLKEK
jgi:hypothetical protein